MDIFSRGKSGGRTQQRALDLLARAIRGRVTEEILRLENYEVLEQFKRYSNLLRSTVLEECRKDKTTGHITELDIGQVFVFGSNLGGIHGKGAAKEALKWGAKYGIGEGEQDQTYAIPTKTKNFKHTLSVRDIQGYVDRFISHAKERPSKTYLVTEIGCGLAGLKPDQIGPLFMSALLMENVHLPKRFWKAIEKELTKRFSKLEIED